MNAPISGTTSISEATALYCQSFPCNSLYLLNVSYTGIHISIFRQALYELVNMYTIYFQFRWHCFKLKLITWQFLIIIYIHENFLLLFTDSYNGIDWLIGRIWLAKDNIFLNSCLGCDKPAVLKNLLWILVVFVIITLDFY